MGFNKIKKSIVLQSFTIKNHRVITLFGFLLFLTHNYDPKSLVDFIRIFLLVLSSICVLTDQSILYFTGILKAAIKRKN
jgi:hypothetical protein